MPTEALATPDRISAADRFPAEDRVLDARTFGVFYQRHYAFVRAYLRRTGVADDRLEDAVQDVFVTAHRRASTFEGRSSVRGWLAGMVGKRCTRPSSG